MFDALNQTAEDYLKLPVATEVRSHPAQKHISRPPSQANCPISMAARPVSTHIPCGVSADGVWVVPFYCDGKFQIRHDVTVTFSGVMYVDTSGTIHLENPQITSDRSGESQMHARWSVHWDNNTLWRWEAAFETRDGLPFLGVAFTFVRETEFS